MALAVVLGGCGQAVALPSIAVGGAAPGVGSATTSPPTSTPPASPDSSSSSPDPLPSAPDPSPTPSPSPYASASSRPSPTPLAPIGFTLNVPILTYHLVATHAEAGNALASLVVPPALFDAQLTKLAAAGWHTITLRQLAADLAAHRRPARHTFVITIDDGHVDGFTEAFPILQRHGMTATYFMIAGRIGRAGYLDGAQVQALAAAGMEIGDHSMFHADLAAIPPDELAGEITGAAAVLRSVVGTAPVTFAYPFGMFDAAVIRAVADAGLQLAVTTEAGVFEAANVRFLIPRLRVGPGTTPAMLLALVGHYPGR